MGIGQSSSWRVTNLYGVLISGFPMTTFLSSVEMHKVIGNFVMLEWVKSDMESCPVSGSRRNVPMPVVESEVSEKKGIGIDV